MSERYKEISSFIPSWRGKQKAQVVEELASYSLETRNIPDPYYFVVRDDGKLISPQTDRPVEDSVEKDSILGRLELEALLRIQSWVADANKGAAIWISPPHLERSAATKIVVSSINCQGSEKILFNRAMLLDINGQDCLNLASEIHDGDAKFISSESLRSNPIFLEVDSEDKLLDFLEKHTISGSWKMIRDGEDLAEKEKALDASEKFYERVFERKIGYDDENIKKIIEREISSGYFGKSPVSCPPTAFEVFYNNSFNEANFVKNCGKCGRKIEKVITKGYRCTCGGVYEGC